jgi:hypothetical protein
VVVGLVTYWRSVPAAANPRTRGLGFEVRVFDFARSAAAPSSVCGSAWLTGSSIPAFSIAAQSRASFSARCSAAASAGRVALDRRHGGECLRVDRGEFPAALLDPGVGLRLRVILANEQGPDQ